MSIKGIKSFLQRKKHATIWMLFGIQIVVGYISVQTDSIACFILMIGVTCVALVYVNTQLKNRRKRRKKRRKNFWELG